MCEQHGNPPPGDQIAPTGSEFTAQAADQRAMRRRVLGLAGPVIGENLLETMLGIVDTLLVAGPGRGGDRRRRQRAAGDVLADRRA